MKLFSIKTNLGYLCGFSEYTYDIKLGRAYQDSGINKPIWSSEFENADKYSSRGLSGVINSITNIIKEGVENIDNINIIIDND